MVKFAKGLFSIYYKNLYWVCKSYADILIYDLNEFKVTYHKFYKIVLIIDTSCVTNDKN